jgi:single-strand DNA-binding protein
MEEYMNNVILIGRTTKEIDLRYTTGTNPTAVTLFTLAVDRMKDGTDFIGCVAFGKTAELMDRYVHKGDKVGIIGRIQTGSYEKDGRKIYKTDVIVERVEFLGSQRRSEPQESIEDNLEPMTDEDIPY